jgi:addiction module HigA family antidote
MAEHTTSPAHPGAYIKASILPSGMSVKKAAELLGVGRPALSNLLNERASLSSEMALRLEKAFGAKRETLLQMQASYDETRIRLREKEVAVRAYAPSFMDITATQIAAWADQTSARPQLAAFLRRLVLTTGSNLTKVDFPAYDNAQRHGWDGRVETDTATPWIPSGVSGWEFGCNQDPRQKAEEDYAARVASIPSTEQKSTTFVFVTPRNWQGKDAWTKAKREDRKWKDVRALDASDLEQWLEQSVPAQSWMAERLGVASEDILSLDVCWDRWSKVTKPELSKELFKGAIETHENTLTNWLKEPPERPLIITADSEEESLAFVACAFESLGAVKGEFYDRAVVLRSVAAFSKATKASSAFIPIIVSPEVESVSAGLHRAQRTIIIRRRNAVEGKPDIALDLIDDTTFRKALTTMGIPDEEVPAYARASGQSATILRRRLSDVPAIKFPPWAEDNALTRKLIPIGFAGVWNSEMKADREILSFLTGDSYENVEKSVAELLNSVQPPVWRVGRMRGVVSKIDVLFGIHRLVTREDLENLFFTARLVLSERDPSLDLPEDQRYAASLYGKTRDHSGPLREGICETLVLLSVHGKNLFRDSPGIDIEAHVNTIVRELLTPFNAETWASQRSDLPRYAEIAPDQFLDIVDTDLRSNDPKIVSLLKPASAGLFGGGCPRTGLLWALELLAWQPERLPHVARLLARLSEPEIDDNWQNKPENSLKSIFRAWMPQTAANVEQRMAVLEAIARQFPKVGWRLCVDQFDPHSTIGHYNERPRWRKDASGAGQPVSGNERYQFARKALDIAIDWPAHNEQTFGDLIESLQSLPDEDKEKVWDRIKEWIASGPSDDQKAALRERIRRYALTRRSRHRKLGSRTKDNAKEISELLLPSDPVVRHHWLFARQWVDESSDEIEDEKFDHEKREAKIAKLRADAVAEVWKATGYEGIVRLCESGEASHLIGGFLVAVIGTGKDAADFVSRLISEPQDRSPAYIESCASGFLSGMDDATRDDFLKSLVMSFESEGFSGVNKIVRLMTCAPFGKATWRRLDSLNPELQTRYWKECRPFWNRHEPDELEEIIDRLLLVNRPRAALFAVHLDLKKVDSNRLMRLLREVATNGSEPAGHYRIDPYEIARAFKVLDSRPEVSGDEVAQLEFLYLSVLDHEERGIPNLERQIAQSPALFVQALGLSYKRNDDGEDPPEWKIGNEEARKNAASQTYRLLRKAKRIPGTKDDGTIDVSALKAWIIEVQALGKKYAREEVADSVIGELLSKSRPGEDGVWPPEPVRQALEETGTEKMAVGMAIGRYNQRGAHFRGPGGDDERALAAQYRGWAQKVSLDSPFTSRLLERIARDYEREAEREDTDATLRRRLVH